LVPGYAPKGYYLWDPWFIKDDHFFHVFYLQASREYDLEERHHHSAIGHACSTDLAGWRELPAALAPGANGSWDDLALWTGSVIKKQQTYYMFYTGRSKKRRWVQKIGLATSTDLIYWSKHAGNPILAADPRYYDTSSSVNRLKNPPAWRDPFVFKDKTTGNYTMIISARTAGRQRVYNGCLGMAVSKDLLEWKVLPPLLSPGIYDELETPSLIHYRNQYYLFFSTCAKNYHPEYENLYGAHDGLHCYCAKKLNGRYKGINGFGVVFSNGKRKYDIQLIRVKDQFWGIGSLFLDGKGNFLGRLSPPFRVVLDGPVIYMKPGSLKIKAAPPSPGGV
jgi:beta-fructofuranosidase